jgi:hypothetical protein
MLHCRRNHLQRSGAGRIVARMLALAAAVAAAAACTQSIPSPQPTTVAPTNTYTAAPASPTTRWGPPPTTTPPRLQPGPHSAIADIDLPAGTIPVRSPDSDGEYWHYTATYPDTLTFLQNRFATGRRYDTYGATWWNGLPPCYDNAHQSPPLGSDGGDRFGGQPGDLHEWMWSDGGLTLYISVSRPGADFGGKKEDALIIIVRWLGPADKNGLTCNRA